MFQLLPVAFLRSVTGWYGDVSCRLLTWFCQTIEGTCAPYCLASSPGLNPMCVIRCKPPHHDSRAKRIQIRIVMRGLTPYHIHGIQSWRRRQTVGGASSLYCLAKPCKQPTRHVTIPTSDASEEGYRKRRCALPLPRNQPALRPQRPGKARPMEELPPEVVVHILSFYPRRTNTPSAAAAGRCCCSRTTRPLARDHGLSHRPAPLHVRHLRRKEWRRLITFLPSLTAIVFVDGGRLYREKYLVNLSRFPELTNLGVRNATWEERMLSYNLADQLQERLTHLSVCNVRLPWPVELIKVATRLTNLRSLLFHQHAEGLGGSTIRPVPCYAFHALLQKLTRLQHLSWGMKGEPPDPLAENYFSPPHPDQAEDDDYRYGGPALTRLELVDYPESILPCRTSPSQVSEEREREERERESCRTSPSQVRQEREREKHSCRTSPSQVGEEREKDRNRGAIERRERETREKETSEKKKTRERKTREKDERDERRRETRESGKRREKNKRERMRDKSDRERGRGKAKDKKE
ncbi:hypothetical protein WMY93_016555 [Mugilogobius chulae]|uniref:F-box domain-containing protein n=1 Tax=Mugilogobius chulae TaxID=88201 RepID=A0AAW0NNJ1_9GOBI